MSFQPGEVWFITSYSSSMPPYSESADILLCTPDCILAAPWQKYMTNSTMMMGTGDWLNMCCVLFLLLVINLVRKVGGCSDLRGSFTPKHKRYQKQTAFCLFSGFSAGRLCVSCPRPAHRGGFFSPTSCFCWTEDVTHPLRCCNTWIWAHARWQTCILLCSSSSNKLHDGRKHGDGVFEILHQFFLLICEKSKQWQGGNYAAMESLFLWWIARLHSSC